MTRQYSAGIAILLAGLAAAVLDLIAAFVLPGLPRQDDAVSAMSPEGEI